VESELIDPILAELLTSIYAADFETGLHSQRTAITALALSKQIGWNEVEQRGFFIGALLHDLGKTRLPPGLLQKREPLTEQEWQIVRRHPEFGYIILHENPQLRPFIDIPYCHHERWDGKGYPRGLKGDEIPLAARIFSMVDLWDALQSNRPYSSAWKEEKTVIYLEAQAGQRLDPRVVKIYLPELMRIKICDRLKPAANLGELILRG
jgi:HD-GYP domain-containing protein (c-di-GMP phosphodiesterase class II)